MFYSWHIIHCSCKSAQMPIRSFNEFKWNNCIYLAEILLTVCFLCWSLLLRVLVAPKGAVFFVRSFDVFRFVVCFFFYVVFSTFFINVFYFGSRHSSLEISPEIHQASMDDIKVKPVVFLVSRFVTTKSACLARFFIFSWSRVQNWDSITHSAASLGSRPFPIRNIIILKLPSSEIGLLQKQSLMARGHSFKGKKTSPLIIWNSFVLLSTTSCRVK